MEQLCARGRPLLRDWNANSSRANLTLRDVFAQQLMQIFGMSGTKAAAIIAKYPTVVHLRRALLSLAPNADAQECMLEDIAVSNGSIRIGLALSRAVCGFYLDRRELMGNDMTA